MTYFSNSSLIDSLPASSKAFIEAQNRILYVLHLQGDVWGAAKFSETRRASESSGSAECSFAAAEREAAATAIAFRNSP